MKNRPLFFLNLTLAFFITTLVLSGCGYTTRSTIGNKYQTIYISPFENKIDVTKEVDAANKYKIYRPMIESDITRSVNDKYLFDGNLRPVREDLAGLILKGEVMEFRKDPLRYDNNDNVSEYRINLLVNISLWDREENRLIWEEKNFTGDTTYFTSGAQEKSETTAMTDALNDLSRRIVERTVEQW